MSHGGNERRSLPGWPDVVLWPAAEFVPFQVKSDGPPLTGAYGAQFASLRALIEVEYRAGIGFRPVGIHLARLGEAVLDWLDPHCDYLEPGA